MGNEQFYTYLLDTFGVDRFISLNLPPEVVNKFKNMAYGKKGEGNYKFSNEFRLQMYLYCIEHEDLIKLRML